MSIIKNTPNFLKKSKQPFTTILNVVIDLIRNDGALGIYCLLASKPEGWEISTKYLMNHFSIGRDSCLKKLKYLKDIGLLRTSPIRDSSGKIIAWETELNNQITENQYSGEPVSTMPGKDLSRTLKNQNLEKPESGFSVPINKGIKQIKNTTNKSTEIDEVVVDDFIQIYQTQFPDKPKILNSKATSKTVKKFIDCWSEMKIHFEDILGKSEMDSRTFEIYLKDICKKSPGYAYNEFETKAGHVMVNTFFTFLNPDNVFKFFNREFS